MSIFSKVFLISLSFIGLFSATDEARAARLEKSSLTSNSSWADIKNNRIVFSDNVIYKHAGMTIFADQLTRTDQGLIEVSGKPVKIHYIDKFNQASDISANQFQYQEQTGALKSQGNIKIIQRSNNDTLTLTGSNLSANKKISQGFSFVLTGNPTHFTIEQPQQEVIHVTAEQLRSNGKDKQTQLLGKVKLTQGTSSTSAPLLTYDGETGLISAQQNNTGDRVETEFFWEKDSEDESQDALPEENPEKAQESPQADKHNEPEAQNPNEPESQS